MKLKSTLSKREDTIKNYYHIGARENSTLFFDSKSLYFLAFPIASVSIPVTISRSLLSLADVLLFLKLTSS